MNNSNKKILTTVLIGMVAMLASGCSDDPVAIGADPVDTAPPATPYLVRSAFDADSGTALITWGENTVDTDLAGYLVTRENKGSVVTLIATPALVQSVEDPAPALGSNLYSVLAVDHAGNQSAVQQVFLNRPLSHMSGLISR